MRTPERALALLREAYGAGHLSTATLEVRAAAVLGGHVEDAIWDLPGRLARWWDRFTAVPEPPRLLGELSLATGGRWLLGREPGCDLVLDADDAVSRRHAELAVRGGVCTIRDLDSTNGTLVNDRPVTLARLRRGDVVQLGETVLRAR